MQTFDGIRENLNFIVMETQKQLSATRAFLGSQHQGDISKILSRDDYIDNLKVIIEEQCYAKINGNKGLSRADINQARAIQAISVNLERIADYCINILQQTRYLQDPAFLGTFGYEDLIIEVIWAAGRITEVLDTGDLNSALDICKAEHEVDLMYKANFDRIMDMLRTGKSVENLITTLFIFRYLERMGDSVLNIGEAIVFAIVGEKIKIEQFQSLRENLSNTTLSRSLAGIDIKGYWGTRSGCRISKVEAQERDSEQPRGIIFKEGSASKIRAEYESLGEWRKLYPALVPEVLSFQEGRDTASMMVQFLPGKTLDEIFLNADGELTEHVLGTVTETLRRVWAETMQDEPADIDYMQQLADRLGRIREVHPRFFKLGQDLAGTAVHSSDRLLAECSGIERAIQSPFSVRIHGDCNVGNLLFDFDEDIIRFIDVYRSRQADYVQDVSVFLVSNFRIPVFHDALRGNLNRAIEGFHGFAREFAADHADGLFDVRLALALARSFYTSTRFEYNDKFAKEMFLRAHYLMEKLIKHRALALPWEKFVLPGQILMY